MLDFANVKTYPIRERVNKYRLADAIPLDSVVRFRSAVLDALAERVRRARAAGRPVIVGLGGAVIKEGCSLVLIDLMRRGFVQHLAVNGAVSIHDLELALIGETSEDVAGGLERGTFGMAEETGRYMNEALRLGASQGWGYGESIGRELGAPDRYPHRESSLLFQAFSLAIPVTVHIAIGGDIVHQHPVCDGAALGATSYADFQRLTESVAGLKEGAYLNVGSAVNLPEVFLKALTVARNLGCDAERFATANFDFLDMYRARTRVVEWPKVLGCEGFDVRGPHRETIPALHRLLTAP
jgi:hypothetical protein